MPDETPAADGYVAVLGFNHDPSETRVEPGQKVPKLPAPVIRSLLAQGAITAAPKGDED